jgi:thiamine-phosphate pyrophosphorylase
VPSVPEPAAAPGFLVTMVTDRRRLGGTAAVERAGMAARAGLDWIQVREKDLGDRPLRALAAAFVAAATGTTARVLVNGRPDIAMAAGAAGVQLPEEGLPLRDVRRAFPALTIGASCHSVEAVRRAAGEGADFVVLGPIFATPGKEERTLGLSVLAEAAAAVAVAVHAIGGVTPDRVPALRAAGARGGAAIRPFLEAPPDEVMRAFRAS